MKKTETMIPCPVFLNSRLQVVLLCLMPVVACVYGATAFAKQTDQPTDASASLKARHLQFSRISQQHSWSKGAVNAVTQDHYGFISSEIQERLDLPDHPTGSSGDFRHDLENPRGLAGNGVTGIFEEHGGAAEHFDRFNGLQGEVFNFDAHLKTNPGQLLSGGTDGLVTPDSERLRVNTHRPDVVLSAHSRYEQLATVYSNAEKKAGTIELGYKDDFILFRFAALDHASSDKNHYRYRLEGFDDDWIESGQGRAATYRSLPAGDYTFTVKASNNDAVWNEQGASFRLHVDPPPWQTLWAYSVYTVIFGGTLVNYKRSQNRKLDRAAKYNAELEREVNERTRELSMRNDELKTLNKKLREASFTDVLTGLKNRRYLYASVDSMVASVGRRAESAKQRNTGANTVDIAPSIFFMMIDLDGFKQINDSYGHDAGDRVLIQVRDVLESSCRWADTIVRWGGDEFMIVGDHSSARAAEQLAERLRCELSERQYQLGDGHVGRLSGSIGFAMYPFAPLQETGLLKWEQVVALADHAAYAAKKNGRNAWVGVYGTRNSMWAEFTKNKIDLARLAKQRMINIRSSLNVIEAFAQQAKQS